MTTIIGVAGGPEAGGRTATAVSGILAGAAGGGVTTELHEISWSSTTDLVAAIDAADAVVFGSSVYRATYSSLL